MALHPPPPPPRAVGGAGVVPLGAGGGGGPRIISAAGAPAATLPGGGMTLDALMARQKELAGRTVEMPEMRSPWQGVAYAVQQGLQGFQTGRAERDAQQGRDALAQAISGIDTTTGELAPDLMANMAGLDPSMAAALKQAQLERTWRVQDREDDQAAAAALAAQKAGTEGAWKPSDIGSLRDDYTKAAASYDSASPTWQSMQEAANTSLDPKNENDPGKGTADYNMIVGFAKLLDPNSVVREGEVKSASMTEGMLNQVQSMLNQWTSNGMLDNGTRQAIMTQSSSRMKSYYDQAKGKRDWLVGVASRHGVNPDDIAPPLSEWKDWQQPGTGAVQVGETKTYDDGQGGTVTVRFKGGDPADKASWEPVH